jgi:hypothetical protein
MVTFLIYGQEQRRLLNLTLKKMKSQTFYFKSYQDLTPQLTDLQDLVTMRVKDTQINLTQKDITLNLQ